MPDKNYLPYEEQGDLYTDERTAPPSVQEQNDPAFSGSQVDQGFDPDIALQEKANPRFRQKDQVRTREDENPGQAVRDAYQDS